MRIIVLIRLSLVLFMGLSFALTGCKKDPEFVEERSSEKSGEAAGATGEKTAYGEKSGNRNAGDDHASDDKGSSDPSSRGNLNKAPGSASLTPSPISTAELQELIKNRDGAALVIHFWASWCAPCVEEWPEVQEVAKKWQKLGIEFVMVSVDESPRAPEITGFLKKTPPTAPNRWWSGDNVEDLTRMISAGWQGSLPVTFVYDGDGELLRAWLQPINRATLEKLLGTLVVTAPTFGRSWQLAGRGSW